MRLRFRIILGLLCVSSVLRAGSVDLMVLGADYATLQPLLSRLTHAERETHAAWTFWTGELAGKSVTVVRTEGDPLNAVAAMTLAARAHPPRLAITFGSARSHDPELRPGDLVVSREFAPFDGMESPRQPEGSGSNPLKWNILPHALLGEKEIKETNAERFPADPAAAALAEHLPWSGGRVIPGVLGSSSHENHEADRIAWLRRTWGTSCEDGESAHLAGCAAILHIPILGLRVVDRPGVDAAAAVLAYVEAAP